MDAKDMQDCRKCYVLMNWLLFSVLSKN